jgi:hypothetical protein
MFIISFDIAIKSLAVAILETDDEWCMKLQIANDNTEIYDKINELRNVINNVIKPIYLDVIDLIPNKKIKETDVVLRSARLKGFLSIIEEKIKNYDNVKILLEYQMGANDLSRNICSQILYHFANTDTNYISANADSNKTIKKKYDIEIVGPSLKNKINFVKDHSEFSKKYSNNYNANKAHSKCNFLYWLDLFGYTYMIQNIKKKNLADISDAFNMAIAWFYMVFSRR